MKHVLKRLLSMILVMTMVVSMFPVSAFASDLEDDPVAPEVEAVNAPTDETQPGSEEVIHEHSYGLSGEVAATCTADGSKSYTCSCGDSYTETVVAAHSYAASESLAATCLENGYTVWVCASCGDTYTEPHFAPGHDWALVEAVEATCTEAGLNHATCYACGAVSKETLAATGHVWTKGECDNCEAVYYDLMMAAETAVGMLAVYKTGAELDYMSLALVQLDELNAKTEAFETLTEEEIALLDKAAAKLATEEVEAKEELLTTWAELIALKAPAVDEAVASVQAMIDALPTTVSSEAECEAVWAAMEAIDEAMAALTEEQQAKLNTTNYDAAIDAAAAFFNPEFDNAGTWADADWYWEGSTLYIKDGKITEGQFYNALTDSNGYTKLTPKARTSTGKYSAELRYAESGASTSTDTGWATYGNKLTSGGSTIIELSNNGSYKAAATTGGGDYTVVKLNKWNSVKNFTVKHYYENNVNYPAVDGATVHMNSEKQASEQVATLTAAIIAGVVKNAGDYADVTPAVYVYGGVIGSNDWHNLDWYTGATGRDEIKNGSERKVKLTWPATGNLPEYSAEVTVKFADLREKLNLTANYTGSAIIVNGTVDSTVYAAALGAITGAPAGVTPTYTYKDVTLSAAAPTNVEVTVTFPKTESYLESSIVVTIPVQLETQPSTITVTNDGSKGSYTLTDTNGHAVTASAGAGVLTIAVTPAAGGNYVESVAVMDKDGNTVAVSGSYNATVYTATFTIANNNAYTIEVSYGTRAMTVDSSNGVALNGYNKDTILNGLKNNVVTALIGNVNNISEYTVEIYVDLLGVYKTWVNPEDASILNTVNGWLTTLNVDFWLEVPSTKQVRITWAGSDKYPSVVWEGTVEMKESRQPANVSLGSFTKEQNSQADFETAILNAINVTNSAGTNIKANAGLTITLNPVDGKVNTYTVSYNVANSGETWLATSGSFNGEFVWTTSVYNITFKNDDGSVLSEKTYPYDTTADKIEAPTATKANEVDANGNVIARYTFSAWTPSVDTVTGEAVYTANYNRIVEKYTVKFYDYDGKQIGETQTVEYGNGATAPTATQNYQTNDKIYTFNAWDTAFDSVVKNIDVKPVYDSVTRYYTVTFQNWNGDELSVIKTLEYGQTPDVTGIVATKAPELDDNGVEIGTYVQKPWNVSAVTVDNKVYTAEFDYVLTQYTITWLANGETFESQKDVYGTAVTLPTGTPADYVDGNGTNWTFDKWDAPANLGAIAGDKQYNAVYKQSGNDAKILRNGEEVYCKDLATALSQAQAGDTIVLLADATMSGKITVDKNITIDGGNHKIIANHSAYILETSSSCTIQNVVLDTNNKAKGVKIASGDVIFDNVTIPNSNKSDAITVLGTLTLKTYFNVATTYTMIDARSGVVNAEPGTVFGMTSFRANASPSKCDLKGAVGPDGKPFFEGYGSTSYYTSIASATSINGLVLLRDSTLNSNKTISGKQTLDLNGQTLTVAEGKAINVNKGQLVIKNGAVVGSIVMNDVGDSVVGSEGMNVSVNADMAAKGYEVVYENGMYCVDLPVPDAIITDIKDTLTGEDPDLTFALNFAFPEDLDEAYVNELFNVYGEWYTDYALTITGLSEESVTFNTDSENADGYLAGQYDAWSESWITVPWEDVTVANGESILIMETAGKMFGQSGLRMTLAEIAAIVQNFDCGVYFTPEFLAANPDLQVSLELRVFAEEEKHGFDYVITLATNEFENTYVAVVDAEGRQSRYFGSFDAAVAAAAEGDTVTLLADAGDATITKSITIDTNGKTVGTLTIGAADVVITAPDGLTVKTSVGDTEVSYQEGKYSLLNLYTVTFVDGDGKTVQSGSVAEGTVPAYTGNTPTKTATAQYSYTFTGWDKEFVAVTGDVIYTAQFDSTVNEYTVIFKDENGTELQSGKLAYGETPSYTGATPSKPTANDINYSFKGWDKEIVAVSGDVTYTAQYNSELNASNGTVAINGYYESKGDSVVFDTLKADVLKAAGLTDSASSYTVEMVYRLGNLNLDKMTGYSNILNATAFFGAVEVPESGRQFVITHNSGASKTVTMKIVDSRPSAGLVSKEITDVKVLDKNDNPTDYINTLLAQVNPNGLNVTVKQTGGTGTWPPAQAGVTYSYVYTVSYESDANWIGGSATLTVNMQSLLNNCTVVPGSNLSAGGSLTVDGSNDNMTVAGNSTVSVTVKPSGSNVVETITVYKNGVELSTFNTNQISYSSKNATVSFNSDGTDIADAYTVEATYSQNYLNLKSDTIVYCMDNDDLTNAELKALVFGAIFDGSSAPMKATNVTLEYAYIGAFGYNLWQDISKGPAINLGSLTHKFGEDGSETIKLTYSDNKFGSFEQTVELKVFDSCYSSTLEIQTVAPAGTEYNFSVKYSAESRAFEGVNYFKHGDALTVTLTPSGDDIGSILEQLYNKTYSETSPYIKDVKVYKNVDGQWVEVASTLERGNGELVDWDNILGGIGNPFAYTAAVTFTPADDTEYKVVAEYDILKLERYELSAQMPMYQAGEGYEAEVPSAQEIVDKFLGKAYAANFIATHGGEWTVEFSTDVAQSVWTPVTDEALLALYDGSTVRIRITWNPTDDNKTYYPVAVTADLTLVDLRTATNVQGSVPTEKVEYVEEAQLIENLKKAMDLAVLANGKAIDVEYNVNYTIRVVEAEGNFATVVVTYHGSEKYKPCQRSFENVPVEDIPDNATIKVTISGAAVNVTNNAGVAQNWDASTELYTVIGNGTYVFTMTPAEAKAIDAVTVNGEKLEAVVGQEKATQMFYKDGVATFSLYLDEKEHYEVVIETVDSVFVLEEERVYDFAYGVQNPENEDIVDAAISYPTDIEYSDVKVEYMAREEGSASVTLPEIDLGFTAVELGTINIDLGELWLDPNAEVAEYDLNKLADELVNELIEKIGTGEVGITDAYSYIEGKLKGLTLGAHSFGAEGDGSTETIRISYTDDKYTLAEVVTDVTIHDPRIATQLIANDCAVAYGYSQAQLIAASGASVDVFAGAKIETNDLYKHAGTHEVTLYFAGDENYQPCKTTINVTVNKASVSVDYDSQIVTAGDNYKFAIAVAPQTLPDGTKCDPELIEFMVGFDAHSLVDSNPSEDNNLAIEDIVGLGQAIGFIQLRLPQSIRELPLVGEYLQGEFTLSAFTDLINSLSDVLGIDESSMEILNQVVEAITGITDRMDIKVIVKDDEFHPTNIGVYVAGAVTIDSDYETAYTADYLIIAPKTTQVDLAWNTELNGMVTLPVWNTMDKGASINGEDVKNFAVKYLVLGVNNDDTGILSTDIYGGIKANLWLDPSAVNDNGAYVQIAWGALWGNELYYAVPLVRSFAIVPAKCDVQLVGSNGIHNRDLLKTFNGQQQGFNMIVTDINGNVVYSDHYQNVVKLADNAQAAIFYTGVQTNGKLYGPTTIAPTHAGAYTAVAVYMEFNGDSKIDLKDLDVTNLDLNDLDELYKLFDLKDAGIDAGVLVIEPSESTITMSETEMRVFGDYYNVADTMGIKASSVNAPAEFVTDPDYTVITASIAATNDFSVNGWAGVTGNVNIDLPVWLDKLLDIEESDTLSAAGLLAEIDKVSGVIDEVVAKLGLDADFTAEAKATVVENVEASFAKLNEILTQLPENTSITFQSDYAVNAVGAYAVVAVVTDSDHYPSVDAGILVIIPEIIEAHLKFNAEDENSIFTQAKLQIFDMGATAYTDESYSTVHEFNDKVVSVYLSIDENGNLITLTDSTKLSNGVWTQLSYIPLEAGGRIAMSNLISRIFLVVPSVEVVELVYSNAADTQNKFEFGFDGTAKALKLAYNGEILEDNYVIYYEGAQTNGVHYKSTEAPVHAGAYVATGVYTLNGINGELFEVGADVALITIDLADSSIEVTGSTVDYDGEEHKASVEITSATRADYTLISGYVGIDADIDTVGIDAIVGTVNIDFPRWLDALIAEHDFSNGVNAVYLKAFLSSIVERTVDSLPMDILVEANILTQDELDAAIAKLTSPINEILALLDKLPENVSITFEDNIGYTEPGAYVYLGVVTDSDHMPSMDTGLLLIEKLDAKFGAWHEVVPYDGKEHNVFVPNDTYGPVKFDYMSMIVDRANNHVNFVLDNDLMYAWNTVERILGVDLPEQFSISELRSILGTDNVDAFVNVLVNVVDALLSEMEKPEDPQDYAQSSYRDLETIRRVLTELPSDGIITVNAPLPVNVGVYEFYVMGYSKYYKPVDASAVLFIEPIRAVVDDNANWKNYGDNDPELTASVSYYSVAGREDPYTWEGKTDGKYGKDYAGYADGNFVKIVYNEVEITEIPDNIGLSYNIVRESGEDVGEYKQTLTATIANNPNYILEIVNDDVFEIKPFAVSVTLDKNSLELKVGEEDTLVATVVPSQASQIVTWTSSDESVATVDENGKVTAVGVGTAIITAKTDNGLTTTCEVTVKPVVIPVEGVTLDKTELALTEGETGALTATVNPDNASNKKVTWTSSDPTIASVDENGNVTAHKAGTVTITATTEDGSKTASCTVTVNPAVIPVTGVTLDKNALNLGKGETQQLTATVNPENASNKNVSWTSSDESVATVDENGNVTAVGRGTATITVTTEDGEFTATCVVTVVYGYPIYFTNANDAAIVAPGMTVAIDGVMYVLDENCTAWADEDDNHRRMAVVYDYTENGNASNPFEYADKCENMYVWDLERNEDNSYTANRVTELDNVLTFKGASIWLSDSGVNGIRVYYEFNAVKEGFAKLGYEVVTHGTVLDWAANLGADGEAERRNTADGAPANYAEGHPEGGNTYTDTIYPATEKYVSNPVRIRFYAELRDLEPDTETGETEDIMLYSGSVQRSIGYVAWMLQDAYNGQVYDTYVEKIIDQAKDHLIEEGLIEG